MFSNGAAALATNEKGINSAFGSWSRERTKLADLKGEKAGGEALSVDEAIVSLEKAIQAVRANPTAALTAEEQQFLRSSYATGGVSESDALSVLTACVDTAKVGKDASEAALTAAVKDDRAAQATAEDSLREAMDAYLNGDALSSLDAVKAAAMVAFGYNGGAKSAFDELAYETKLSGAYFELSAGAPGFDQLYESAKAASIASYSEAVKALNAARLAALKEVRQAEWDLWGQDLARKESQWSSMVTMTVGKAAAAWKAAADKLDASYQAWENAFKDEYQAKAELWAENYLAFAEKKQAWVDDLALKAGRAGSEQILAEAGMGAGLQSRDLSFVACMSTTAEPASMVSELLGGMNLGETVATLGKRNASIASVAYDLQRGLGMDAYGSSSAMALAAKFQASQDSELGTRAALIVADQARDSLAKAKEGYKKLVVQANEGFESSMDDMYLGSAFLKTGGAYVRDAIVDATAGGALKERQRVTTYSAYAVPDFATRTGLAEGDLAGLGAEAIQARTDKAMKELDDKRQEIFGKDDMSLAEKEALKKSLSINGEGGPQDLTDCTEVDETYTEWETTTDKNGRAVTRQVQRTRKKKIYNLRTETQELGAGDFGQHVGYAPIFQLKPNADDIARPEDLVVAAGEGESGRLMMYFSYFQLKEGKGIAEYSKPSWDRRIWDDRGSWLKAPTPAQVVDVGVSIAAMAVGVGPWAAMAINLADDAVFGMMDVSGGYRQADEALVAFGKKALTSAATTVIGGVFDGGGVFGSFGGLSSSVKDSGLGGAIAKTMLKGMEVFTTNVASGAIAGIGYSHGGEWSYNKDAFDAGVSGEGALASYASSMAGTFATGMLDTQLIGFVGPVYAGGLRLDSLAGSLVGQGVNYALTKDATFNVANLSMLGLTDSKGRPLSMGLVEMRLGDSGISMGLGSGGADISLDTLAGAAGGVASWGENLRIETSGQDEAKKYLIAMRTLASTGNASDANLYGELLAGATDIVDDREGDYSALTTLDGGKRTIHLGTDSSILTSDLSMGVLLSHEGYRNGIDDGQGQIDETVRALQGHAETAALLEGTYGTGALGGRMSAELAALRSGDPDAIAAAFGSYSTEADYWKLMKNGNIAYDGVATLRDENGNIIHSAASMGLKETQLEGSLLKILGIDPKNEAQVKAVQGLMVSAGIQHSTSSDPDQWAWGGERPVIVAWEGSKGTIPVTATVELDRKESRQGNIVGRNTQFVLVDTRE